MDVNKAIFLTPNVALYISEVETANIPSKGINNKYVSKMLLKVIKNDIYKKVKE
jgi:hypothetical protein